MFPEEFFRQAYRLLQWEYRPGVANRNRNVGKWINKYIYEKLPPGVLPELTRLNPLTSSGSKLLPHDHHENLG
jgi:P63C domain